MKLKLIETLNGLIMAERLAAAQYQSQRAEAAHKQYGKLAEHYKVEAAEELGHLDTLLGRMAFLDGVPAMCEKLQYRRITDIQEMLEDDLDLERSAVEKYAKAIDICITEGDHATREVLEDILADEDRAVIWLEGQLAQLKEVGLQNFLAGWA